MAEEMQGIMSLLEGQPQEETGQLDPNQFSPVIEGYAKANPRQFSRDILNSIAEVDPAVAQQFVSALSTMQLPPEVIDALQLMVDNILQDPQNYAENRQILISEGVPEEILPEQFDPAYFAAFNLALDQLDQNKEPEMPTYAKGGIINAKKIAKELANMGRGGDTMLAHITPQEARMLRMQGGSGTINPKTGLHEFGFFSSIGKAIGGVFKGVSKAIKGVVKGVGSLVKSIAKSTIGKIALSFAAVYFMGPAGLNLAGSAGSITGITNAVAANVVNTVAGSTLVNLASGQKIGDAIKGGIVAGALAGAGTAIFGGGVPGAPRTDGGAPILDMSRSATGAGTAGSTLDDVALAGVPKPTAMGPSSVSATTPLPGQAAFEQSMGLDKFTNIGAGSNVAQTFPLGTQPPVVGTPIGEAPSAALTGGIENLQAATQFQTPTPFQMPTASSISEKYLGTGAYTPPTVAPPVTTGGIENLQTATPGFMESLKQGNLTDAASAAWKNISPSEIQKAGIPAAQKAGEDAIKSLLTRIPNASSVAQQAAYDSAYKAAMPGLISTYGPAAAVGLGAAYLGGAFDAPKQQLPDNMKEFETTGADLLAKEPGKYGLEFGGVKTTYAPNPYEKLYAGYQTPRLYARGGEAYPRKTGHIAGPGTGTSDSVPAMLSDGEFVFTAKAVRAMGNGSRRKGAKRMYALMKHLEKKG